MTEQTLIFHTEDGEIFEIPPEGMLGLLALGAVGVKAWRNKRQQAGVESHWEIKPPKADNTNKMNAIEDFHTQGINND